jgi:hypothetical protein
MIWLLDSVSVIQDEETQVFGCKRSRCKRYYNLDVNALDVNVIITWLLDSVKVIQE